ncbi:DNA methyltransferase [Mycoplasma leachii]|nr:DNA methyltransferase [Mycoplasma leachii]
MHNRGEDSEKDSKNSLLNEKPISKYVIWALYDDAESSYQKAIKKYFDNEFIVYSIGINDPSKIKFKESENYKYKQIDLSLLNFNLINQLKQLEKPDIILASPPCESWSGADCGGKMFAKITTTSEKVEDDTSIWKVRNKKYYDEYNKTAHPVKRRLFLQKEIGRILGISTIGATIHIIQTFKPKIWIIENPATSKTWDFQKHHWDFHNKFYENKTYYSSYDIDFSLKPTIFKSNIKLDLLTNRNKGNNDHMARGSYSKRSSIPSELIKDIINQIKIKLNKKSK